MQIFSLVPAWLLNIDLIARAGGGGSGGSSSGGGDGLIVLLGYVPMHILGAVFSKKLPKLLANILGFIVAIIYGAFWLLTGFIGLFIALAAIFGMCAGLYGWFDKIAKLSGIAKKKQLEAVQKDSAWDMDKLNSQVNSVFMRFQQDWGSSNLESMKSYLTPIYWQHIQLMLASLGQLGRSNIIEQPIIKSMDIIELNDSSDNTQDLFVMAISAVANDKLIDSKTNEVIFSDNNSFSEYWRFVRNVDNNWLLDGINQATEDLYMLNGSILQFAAKYKYFYSPDWGWLLLPRHGQLFGNGKFGVSDINNHVIGVYNNTIIQLYNYIANPNVKINGKSKNYIIAQVALPKSYGNIVVRKKKLFQFGIKGLTKISMEWGDFNKKYQVWASDMERVTSFELLNPSFMVKLQELPFEVNMEVVDNIVYLYSGQAEVIPENYEAMLSILYQAFKEMRM